MNTKIISSLAEPIYPINYDTAQTQAGNTYTCNIAYSNIPGSQGITTILRIVNPNFSNVTTAITSIILYATVGGNNYVLYANASLSGMLVTQTIYNTNMASTNTSKTIISAASSSSISVNGPILCNTSYPENTYMQILPSRIILTSNNSLSLDVRPVAYIRDVVLNIIFSEN